MVCKKPGRLPGHYSQLPTGHLIAAPQAPRMEAIEPGPPASATPVVATAEATAPPIDYVVLVGDDTHKYPPALTGTLAVLLNDVGNVTFRYRSASR
jgi:hypothetical protein